MADLSIKSKRYFIIIDIIKAFAIIFVIMNHSGMFDRYRNVFFLLIIDKAVPIFMIMSGFVFALQYYSNDNVIDLYRFNSLKKRFIRYTLPMIIAFLLYCLLLALKKQSISPLSLVKCLVLGQYGQGAYYYDLMIQFMLLAPILLILLKKYREKGILCIVLINFGFELICKLIGLPTSIYRVLIFRYQTAIGCGMYLYGMQMEWKPEKESRRYIYLCLWIAGFIYVLLPAFGYEYHFFSYKPWGRTSLVSCFYIFPFIFFLIYRFLEDTRLDDIRICRVFATIGKSSYHILYVQMVYYLYRPAFDSHIFDISSLGKVIEMGINLLFSITFGILYFKSEKWFFKSLSNRENASTILPKQDRVK